jgi:hypothetical protein
MNDQVSFKLPLSQLIMKQKLFISELLQEEEILFLQIHNVLLIGMF